MFQEIDNSEIPLIKKEEVRFQIHDLLLCGLQPGKKHCCFYYSELFLQILTRRCAGRAFSKPVSPCRNRVAFLTHVVGNQDFSTSISSSTSLAFRAERNTLPCLCSISEATLPKGY
jgi:hypothetical protein